MNPLGIFALALVFPLLANASESITQLMTSQQLIQSGREGFLQRCSGCHGTQADGQGPAAKMLSPQPRNLLNGSFKLRSTPSGVLPTVEDLLKTIDQGIPGTSMPSFRELSSFEKLALVAYVRSLRPEFKETLSDQISIPLGMPPKAIFGDKKSLFAAAKKGKKFYDKTCFNCHGMSGRGNGLSAEGMTDSDDRPIVPADLTARTLKSGPTARDAFKAISTGFDGAPMPGFMDSMSETQRWELVAYIFYLRGQAAGIYDEKETLE